MTVHTNYNDKASILSIFSQYHGPFNLALIQQYYSPLNEHQLQQILSELVAEGSITALENGYFRLS